MVGGVRVIEAPDASNEGYPGPAGKEGGRPVSLHEGPGEPSLEESGDSITGTPPTKGLYIPSSLSPEYVFCALLRSEE